MRKINKRKKNKYYFTKVHEQAIIDFVASDDELEKNRIYREILWPVFDELVNNIAHAYKFRHNLQNIDAYKDECKTWLPDVLDKFDSTRGYKAFSYFTVIIRNWFIDKIKKQKKSALIPLNEIYFDEYVINEPTEELIEKEFYNRLEKEFYDWMDDIDLTCEDKIVLNAIITLFEKRNELEIFTKNGIYIYLREITNLSTQKITIARKNLQEYYQWFVWDWLNEE